MCEPRESVPLETRILSRNDRTAAHNREHFLDHGIFAINLMGSPGSGKTAVLEATARAFQDGRRLAAMAGDLATDNDASRLQRAGIRSRAITTGQACHLDADMVHHELHSFPLDGVEYFFIENVGNLVCPAVYDLGQNANVVCLAITEGEDKPLKYPTMFAKADAVLLTKMDLLPHLSVDIAAIYDALAHVMPKRVVIPMASTANGGVDDWITWLQQQHAAMPEPVLA